MNPLSLFSGISNLSSLKVLGYSGALFGSIIAGMVLYHTLDEAKDALTLALVEKQLADQKLTTQETKTDLVEVRGNLLSEQQQRQTDKTTIAFLRKEVSKWKVLYEKDTGICKDLFGKATAEADRRRLVEEKLEAFYKANPNNKMSPERLKLLNGE